MLYTLIYVIQILNMDKTLLIILIVMLLFFVVSTIRFINDIKMKDKYERVNAFILEKNLTKNNCQAYCILLEDKK